MANLLFPANPAAGDVVTLTNGVSYTWTGSYWSGSTDDPYVKKAGDTMTGDLVVPSMNGGPLAGFRNIIVNGDVTINQRGKTYAERPEGEYWADRWKKVSGGMTQVIEPGNYEANSTYTLSGNGVTTQQVTSPSSGNWTIPTIPSTATKIQLELGTQVTPFERRPFAIELSLCQRYHQKMNVKIMFDQMNHGISWYSSFVTPMRAKPSVGLTSKLKWDELITGKLSSDPYFSTGVNASSKVIFTSRCHVYIKLSGSNPGANVKYAYEEAIGLDAEL
jgi:hypothetical protein